jgi:hypothetical protein
MRSPEQKTVSRRRQKLRSISLHKQNKSVLRCQYRTGWGDAPFINPPFYFVRWDKGDMETAYNL